MVDKNKKQSLKQILSKMFLLNNNPQNNKKSKKNHKKKCLSKIE
jgi:hypothetical protein